VTARVEPGKVRAAGDALQLVIDPANIHLFDADSTRRLLPA